jgi:hypothetical protein
MPLGIVVDALFPLFTECQVAIPAIEPRRRALANVHVWGHVVFPPITTPAAFTRRIDNVDVTLE